MPADLAQLAGWAYLLMALAVIADAVFPLVPAETVAIGGGVLAASGALNLAALLGVVAVGAAAGDALSYQLGRRVSRSAWAGSCGTGAAGKQCVDHPATATPDGAGAGRRPVRARWTDGDHDDGGIPACAGSTFHAGGRSRCGVLGQLRHRTGIPGRPRGGGSLWVAMLVGVGLAAALTVAIELLRRMVAGRLSAGREPR